MSRPRIDPEIKALNIKVSKAKYMKKYLSTPEARDKYREYMRKYMKDYIKNPKVKAVIQERNKNIKTRTKARDRHLKRERGITIDQFNVMYEKQKGRCAICKTHQSKLRTALCVDHDHKTGKIRGLLCHRCNMAIGILNDSTKMLYDAINYLQNYGKD